MFNDLRDNKAIKMGGVFIVKLPRYYRASYEINGVRSDGGLHTVPNLDCVFSVISARKDLKHYLLGDEQLSVADYKEKSPHAYYDEDYEEYQFDSLEHEYEVKKEWERVKDAIPVYDETPEHLEPVELELIGEQIETGSEFISTPYQLGKAFFNAQTQGIFSIDLHSVACDEVSKIKVQYPNVKIINSDHSGLTYLKVNGEYVYGSGTHDGCITGKISNRVLTKLDDAKALENETRQKVRSRLMMKIKPVSADAVLVADLYSFLKRVSFNVSDIDAKQKSQTSKRVLLNILHDKMKELEEFITNS